MNQFLSFFLFRVVLPIFFVAAFAFRFNGISCIYLLLFLISPLLATPSNASLASHTGRYLKALTGLCVLLSLGQIIFQIVLLSTPPYGNYLIYCKQLEVILRHVGFVRYNELDYLSVARHVLPEILMLIISISLLVVFRKKADVEIVSEPPALQQQSPSNLPVASILSPKFKRTSITVALNIFVDLLLLAAASVARPSITSAVYLLLFLAIATWVACYKNLGRKFAILRVLILVFTAIHIMILYLYQFHFLQDLIPSDNLYVRLFGLTKLVSTSCDDPRVLHFENLEWASFANPGILCLLYWVLAIQTKSHFASKLLASDGGSRTYQTVGPGEEEGLEIDPNGSAIWSSHPSEIPPDVEVPPPDDRFKTLKNWLSPFVSIVQLITRQSYIATLIIMMAWSITYHSWLTFILLLWSCILWMMPNSRTACWKSSPFLVAYAEALIIIQYIYSLNLYDSELPRTVETVNLAQIGLNKVEYLACIPLSIKILYTVMFWITLRQYMQEKFQERNKDIAEGVMMRPVNMAYATAQSADQSQPDLQRQQSVSQGSKLMKKLGEFVHSLLTKYFIWLVALMLMLNALGGEEVVIFRIIYMALFLFFILMFQLSYSLWRKIMYGFWLTVIMYSMTLLILIYTYQFEYFPDYWETYLQISKDLQRDIGLEVYDTGGLFLNLLRATFFVVITIIQLHYFHKDFLRISDIDRVEDETDKTSLIVAVETEPNVGHQDVAPLETGEEFPLSDSQVSDVEDVDINVDQKKPKSSLKATIIEVGKKVWKKILYWYDLISDFCWRYLEIHIIKIVLLSVLLLALHDVCAVHFIFVMFVMVATPVRKIQGFISHCCALWASILLISKMIYQIDYIQEYWVVNCTDVDSRINGTVNNAHWMGFSKVTELPSYLKGYLGLIFVLTIQAVIRVRMRHHRVVTNEVEPKYGIMFPEIRRVHADENLVKCIKYLINFGCYKFGIEICLMTITAGIGVRLDLFAVVYAIILATLFLLRRKTLAKIWPFYVAFLAILIPVQYIMCVGLPPGLCIAYLYEESMNTELREWLFLPDYIKPPEAYKLTVDFFLLLFACCQLHVFAIETSAEAEEYEGGSNKEIIYLPDYPNNNPVADYVTNTKSYLDLVKVGIFFSLYWVTLAIFFLAGTNRVSLFAMGYVIGCFLFLWNGQEFFLKPIAYILKWWNVLLGYTVAVICIKSILQLIGCVFINNLYANFCWLIQLFGIACLKKFERNVQQPLIPSPVPDDCQVPVDEAGLLWDGICLAFLLLQKRFFCSYYFPHLVTEMRAQAALANRGAELINQMLMKEVLEQQAAEKEIVEKIKKKMDKIRMHQQKIRGDEYVEPDSHYSAIRSGDYYLFDDFSDDEGLVELEYGAAKKAKEKEEGEDEVPVKGIPVSKLLASAMKTDIKHAVSAAQKAKGIESDSEPTTSGPTDRSGKTPVSRTVSGGSQVSFALSHRDSLSPHDIPRRPQTLPALHATEDGKDQPSSGADTSDQQPSDTLGERHRERDDKEPPSPGSGKPPGDGLGDEETKDESTEESLGQKIQNFMKFLWVFIEGLMVSATAKLNLISRDYRYVARSLSKEKKSLKEKWLRGEKDSKEIPISVDLSSSEKTPAPDDTLQIRVEKASEDRTDDSVIDENLEDQQKEFEAEQPPIVRLLVAIWYAVVSRSEIVCYIMIVVNQINSASILSLPLPFMVFLWGTLSIPRPSKSFWITIITYTEAIVVIKYMFQFGFFPWNQETRPPNQPFWAPRILGIEKKDQYAVYDLALLLVVFFHRFILKSLGLWKDTSKSDIDTSLSTEVKDTSQTEQSESTEISERKKSLTVSQKEYAVTEIIDTTGGGTLLLGFLQYIQPIRSFAYNLLNPPYRVTKDVYAFMFICDFITFLIVVFGYWAFGTGGGEGVASYFEEDKVPVPFLIMLIAQFALIVIDRALFLRKYIVGKLIFQVVIVFIVHLWMFFILPVVTEKKFNSNLPPQLWYFVKSMYLLLSAYQIRSGYPTRILGNFLTKKYNYVNLILFKGFMAVPFLFELRALMDWIWTDTSMAIGSWLKMEDIFAHIFVTKCNRRAEAEYPVARGSNRKAVVKYGVGGTLLFIIILLIWFPLVLFALGNTVGLKNPPIGCTIEVSFSGFEPIFKISAQYSDLKQFTEANYETLRYQMRANPSAQTFLSNFDYWDIYVAQLSGSSTSFWTISPPSVDKLARDLTSDNDLTMRFSWQFAHATTGKDTEPVVGDEYIKVLQKNDPIRKQLVEMIRTMSQPDAVPTTPVTITHIMPKFIRVPSKGKAAAVKAFLPDKEYYSNITLTLEKGAYKSTTDAKFWWVIHEDCENNPYKWLPYTTDGCNEDNVTLVSFNDKVFPATLSVLSGYGIIGLYTTLVLVASRFVRGIVAGVSYTIMFDDMPCVDRVLQLCLDIYLVRESGELKLEEDLFAKLVFLYRSPETLIKWTRYPAVQQQAEE